MEKLNVQPIYVQNKYAKVAILCAFGIYLLYFWGYRITPQLITGNLRTFNNQRAGFSISISPYWRLYRSGTPGIKTASNAVLITTDGVLNWRQSTVIVNKQRADSPSLDQALLWANEETSYEINDFFHDFETRNLNGRESFISEAQYDNKHHIFIVVLGERNEFVIHLVTEDANDLSLFQQMIDSFAILDGF